MKAVLTFIFIIFIGTTAIAQSSKKETKVAIASVGVELNITIEKKDVKEGQVARLYMFKNSRIKKALNFKTKRNASKIA